MATVFIRDNATGEVRTMPWEDDWVDVDDYLWSEGNYACDCNRALFFARAVGEDDPSRSCGDGAYSVRIVSSDGRELYADDDWQPEVAKQ